jgi:hypothetical protein
MRVDQSISDVEKKQVMAAVNKVYLARRHREWGNHGIRRTFRFWTEPQKADYIGLANELIAALTELTPQVTYGFGSVLGFVRDSGFIPHDDDLDVLIAFPADGLTFEAAKQLVRTHLEPRGFTLHGDYLSHFNVTKGELAAVDVFIGFDEDAKVSWFPSRRGGLKSSEVFPTKTIEICGLPCVVPADPERYLAVTYGDDWRHPIANWNHPWNANEYADFR